MKSPTVLLIILDGWGLRDNGPGNAIEQAQPTFYEELLATRPWVPLAVSGEAVGLPEGQMGNSEVGHLNMAAGRIVYQDLTRIDKAIRDGTFIQNQVLQQAMQVAVANQSTLHLMGLVSPGGVHSHQNHLLALLDMAKRHGVEKLQVHAFLDGRDVPPQSAASSLELVEQKLLDLDYPQIATISGRYYAMDRDNRWERTEKAYHNLVLANGRKQLFSGHALQYTYNQDETDEFVLPTVCDLAFEGIADHDSILFFNFRPDRARQLTRAFTDPAFSGFDRQRVPANIRFTCMALYDETFHLPVAYTKEPLNDILPDILSRNGIRQFRTAETEKYAHVTYFFNGGVEKPYPLEDRQLVPSPKVATYDLQPEMSLAGVTQVLLDALESQQYGFIACNFANPDMVGHTGKLDAAIDAVKAVNTALETIMTRALALDNMVLVTADHGNIETMMEPDGSPHTAHTTNPVPCILVANDVTLRLVARPQNALSCIAPTILDLMGLPVPSAMTSPSLLVRQAGTIPSSPV